MTIIVARDKAPKNARLQLLHFYRPILYTLFTGLAKASRVLRPITPPPQALQATATAHRQGRALVAADDQPPS